MQTKFAALLALAAAARAQQVCTSQAEVHPALQWQKCAAGGTCTNVAGSVVLDSNWRWAHTVQGSTNCYTGNTWNNDYCATGKGADCATKCCVDGADYPGTYGITTSGNELNLKFVTTHAYGKNIGSRVYLMKDQSTYEMFTLLGNEFTFDVDVSNIDCGLNGALYFVSMDADGGLSKFSTNKAGAKYGTGYCDSQCPRDVKFIDGVANVDGWNPSSNDQNGGVGVLGACCAEMDIWEANKISTAYTPHPCQNNAYHSCKGDLCGGTYSSDRYAGDCDPDGCDFNSYRQGNKSFYGPGSGFTLDTTKKLTIVTQFLKGSDGILSEIKRFYVQNDKVVPNSQSVIASNPGNSLTPSFCDAQKAAFGDIDIFKARGGFTQMSDAVAKPMVLVLSLWDDHYANMLWLDSTYPVDAAPGTPGAERGSCPTTSGVPADVEANAPNSNVKFSNIKFGPINSTFKATGIVDPPPVSSTSRPGTTVTSRPGTTISTSTRAATTSAPPTGGASPKWGQCGGKEWAGPFACVAGSTCTFVNEWYSQCI
ncbi:exoglucanase type C precursor [Colletotrichum tofieldiae]|uniref:Glucanase n=1 Tax=Colletotrichum tofieldiae TaxID=708197 RepID=A0A166R2S5_9PEZI|nr:exoglucanase type C precursor (glycosyl hydrolase family 7) [Colletotrichum tofieldiae]GKT54559.1 exoglucanase type C precursor [Colletotrichum tofieldiae]GKT81231.1 exoglucanase type C precursor [Colletotrichum tofieldiae]